MSCKFTCVLDGKRVNWWIRSCDFEEHGESKTNDIAEHINLSPARTRALLKEIKEVQAMGGNSNRTYKLENNR